MNDGGFSLGRMSTNWFSFLVVSQWPTLRGSLWSFLVGARCPSQNTRWIVFLGREISSRMDQWTALRLLKF